MAEKVERGIHFWKGFFSTKVHLSFRKEQTRGNSRGWPVYSTTIVGRYNL